MTFRILPLVSALALLLSTVSPILAHDGENHEGNKEEQGWPGSTKGQEMARAFLADAQPAADLAAQAATTCTDGLAGEYPCSNVDLLSFLPLADIGGGKGNDIWGWTDSGREYAIMGRTTGTAFVDITVPESPVYLGNLPTTRFSSTWRDIKVYENYAFIVSESRNHGMQVFDLTRLRGLTAPVTFSADALYTGFATAHNIAINEESGFAYAIGTNTCSGGLHIVDINIPTSPTQAGCFSADGYTHDVQCVNYAGPDTTRTGRELCFASNEDTLTIVDVTDKAAPIQLARETYEGASYTHQGWLTDDQRYFLIDDEADEGKGFNTRTYVFDVANPGAPVHIGTHVGSNPAIDHNQYIVGNHSYQANYRSGLRILDISGVATPSLNEVAYFDIYPADDLPEFNGAWSVYPFFASGNVVVSGIEQGLYVLQPNLGPSDAPPSVAISSPADGTIVSGTVTIQVDASDPEDAAGTLNVDVAIDGTFADATYNAVTGYYELVWDTTGAGEGAHTIDARATDSADQTTNAVQRSVTVDNIDEAPAVVIANPTNGSTVAGTVTIQVDASDPEDAAGTLAVTVSIDSGAAQTAPYNSASGYYEYNWDTTPLTNGTVHTIDAQATDTGGNTTLAVEISVTVDNSTPTTMHVESLTGSSENKGSTWTAHATILVHNSASEPVNGVTVSGSWSNGTTGTGTCTTGLGTNPAGDPNPAGTCTISKSLIAKRVRSVEFTITGLTDTATTNTLAWDTVNPGPTTVTIFKP